MVDYYDTPTPLNQLASVSAPTPTQLVIDAYDKSGIGDIEKALMMSDLGMTPNNDGRVIRLNVPQLTSDRRTVRQRRATAPGEGDRTTGERANRPHWYRASDHHAAALAILNAGDAPAAEGARRWHVARAGAGKDGALARGGGQGRSSQCAQVGP
eukprot:3561165-Prymnesium_polylepis.2